MEDKLKVLKEKVSKLRNTLETETESCKQGSLELRKRLDQFKAKEVLKSLLLKRRLSESTSSLQESRIAWASDLHSVYNSTEHYKTSKLQQQYLKEKLYTELSQLLSSLNLSSPAAGSLLSTLDLTKLKSLEASSAFETLCNNTDTNLNTSLQKTMDTDNVRIKSSIKPLKLEDLSLVDEDLESSYEGCQSEYAAIERCKASGRSAIFQLCIEQSSRGKSEKAVSVKQPEEEIEEIEDTMIAGIEFVGVTTIGDHILGKGDVEDAYIVKDEEENDVPIKKRGWKKWVCPCLF